MSGMELKPEESVEKVFKHDIKIICHGDEQVPTCVITLQPDSTPILQLDEDDIAYLNNMKFREDENERKRKIEESDSAMKAANGQTMAEKRIKLEPTEKEDDSDDLQILYENLCKVEDDDDYMPQILYDSNERPKEEVGEMDVEIIEDDSTSSSSSSSSSEDESEESSEEDQPLKVVLPDVELTYPFKILKEDY